MQRAIVGSIIIIALLVGSGRAVLDTRVDNVKDKEEREERVKVYKNIVFDLFDVLIGNIGKKGKRILRPFPEAVELFYELKKQGYKLYLLSNVARSRFDRIMKKAQDSHSEWSFFIEFDGYMTSFKAGFSKPHEHIFQRLIDDFFLLPEECFFIDDKQMNIDAAARFGIDGAVCRNHDHSELKKILKKLKILTDRVD